MAARPKGMDRALRKPSIFGNKRRNSSATAARLRSTDWAVGWVSDGLFPKAKTIEQNKNNAKMVSRRRGAFHSAPLPTHNHVVMDCAMHAAASDALFKSLADPTRRALFERLCREGEQTVAALTARAGVSQPAVSKHLAILKQAGLVRDRHEGRQTHYSAQPSALAPLIDWTSLMRGFWQSRFDRLEDLLKRIDQ
jgi:DNA-binding transcriptional ArsR family regulator